MKTKFIIKPKIITILGTRPEIIRLSCILPKMDQYFDHIIIFTQQSYDYEMSQIFFEEFNLRKPDYVLDVKSQTLGGQLSNIFKQSEEVLLKEKPDSLFVLGDTNSVLVTILARRMHIPIFHMEAGNRAFDYDIPEEINRRIVDHVSDFNLAYTEHARRYLIREGIPQETIFVIGSPFPEIFKQYADKIKSSNIMEELGLVSKKYFLVSAHREENVDNEEHLKELFASFDFLTEVYNLPIIVTLHPRTKKRLQEFKIKINPKVRLHKPFGFLAYNKLQINALCVLSDSGSVQEESAILGFPAIQMRKSSERPEAFDAGSIVLTGFNKNTIVNAINITISQFESGEEIVTPSGYKDTNISTKVVKIIAGLTGIRKYQHQ